MKIKCQKCQEVFDADEKQSQILEAGILKGTKLIFIECPICYKDSYVDPFNLLNEQKDKKKTVDEIVECPICHDGIVSYIDDGDEKFWGCGECGNVWFTPDELNNALDKSKK